MGNRTSASRSHADHAGHHWRFSTDGQCRTLFFSHDAALILYLRFDREEDRVWRSPEHDGSCSGDFDFLGQL